MHFNCCNVFHCPYHRELFINDGERGLHADYDKWLEELAPHAPTSQYLHNRTGEACPAWNAGTTVMPT